MGLSRTSLLFLVATVMLAYLDTSLGQQRRCTYQFNYTTYLWQVVCTTPSCPARLNTNLYKHVSYAACCGTNSVVSNGNCCVYKRRYYNYDYTYCMCTTGTTCGGRAPVTVTTTPVTTTTTVPPRILCPSYRLLNSDPANECDFPGVTSIERNDGQISTCNAVLVPLQIGGTTKTAFFTSKLCKEQLLNVAIKLKTPFNMKIGNRSYPIDTGDMFDIVDDPTKGSSFLVVKDRFKSIFDFTGSCQQPACVMSESKIGQIEFDDCEIASYGATSATDLTQAGLRKVKVRVTVNEACANQTERFGEVNTMCFTTTSGENLFCSNDMGAPVFCRSKSKEKIMIGGASFQTACDSSPHFRLIPYPITPLTPVPPATG